MSYKVDFHTHSEASPDGALTPGYYRRVLEHGLLDAIAITDHNTIEMAERMHKELGDKIIVGEEITTRAGEIIGLFLTKLVPAMLTPEEAVRRIHDQGGLVYVPHPFETVRKGLKQRDLDAISAGVDIIELHNGRAVFQNRSTDAIAWAKRHKVPGAASSDSHGLAGWGKTYTVLSDPPTRENLMTLLRHAEFKHASPGVRGVLYPKFNRLRKKWRR